MYRNSGHGIRRYRVFNPPRLHCCVATPLVLWHANGDAPSLSSGVDGTTLLRRPGQAWLSDAAETPCSPMGKRAWVKHWGGRPGPRSLAVQRQLRERNPAWRASGAGEWLHASMAMRTTGSGPFVTPSSWVSGVGRDCFWRGALRLTARIFCEKQVV